MSTERILDKIRKCMAMAKDSRGNAAECENAMRQAQALMAKHGISELDLDAAMVTTLILRSRVSVKRPAQWEVSMCHAICSMYGLHAPLWSAGGPNPTNKGLWTFIGSKAYTEVAEYTYEVLYRQLLAARNEFVRNLHDSYSRGQKSEMANSFCSGWVHQVSKQIHALDDTDGEMKRRIDAYMAKMELKIRPSKGAHDRDKEIDGRAFVEGVKTAADVRLNKATGHAANEQLRIS